MTVYAVAARLLGPDGSLPRRAVAVAVITANFVGVLILAAGFFVSDVGYDWEIFIEAGRRAATGGLYEWDAYYAWSYSPLLAYLFAAIAPIGFWAWSALHLGALALLRDRVLAAVALVSFPFWADIYNGNTVTFVFVAAVWALRGNSLGIGAYLALFMTMPRPLMLPLVAWILWHHPSWRVGFVAFGAINAALVLATGYGTEWIATLLGVGGAVAATSRDIGPGNLIGPWWVLVGGCLAVILTVRGHLGFASMAAAPYWLPQYLLMVLLQLVPKPAGSESSTPRRNDEVAEVI